VLHYRRLGWLARDKHSSLFLSYEENEVLGIWLFGRLPVLPTNIRLGVGITFNYCIIFLFKPKPLHNVGKILTIMKWSSLNRTDFKKMKC
jgi:hypothetical protein